MKNVENWKLSAEHLMLKNPKGFLICKSFCSLLDYIHQNQWQGACHASSTVLFSLLTSQGIEVELYLGKVSVEVITFDHSWIEIDGDIYDVAISNALTTGSDFPPVFRNLDLSTGEPTKLRYETPDYNEATQKIRSTKVSEYMEGYPEHTEGLFGITVLVGQSAGIPVNVNTVKSCVINAVWKDKT